jgi:uncharacterized membrane protein
MDGLCSALHGGTNDPLDVEVTVGRARATDAHGYVGQRDVASRSIRVTVDGDGTNAESAKGRDDATGDLAAVGNQYGVEHGHILKTP